MKRGLTEKPVLVPDARGYPDRAVAGGHPGAALGANRQNPGADIAELVIITPVAVDHLSRVINLDVCRYDGLVANLRHNEADCRKYEQPASRHRELVSTEQTIAAEDGSPKRPASHWRRMRVWASAHAVDDFYQGLVPAAVPYFVLERRVSYLGASSALGGTALTLELAGGVLGPLAGGRIGDRIGLVRTVQLGNALLIPTLVALLACDNKYAALPLVLLVGLVTNILFAVLVKLGQDYLPTRPGTAAGVTLGLAVSAGGLFLPLLGLVVDGHGPRGAFIVLAVIPVIAVAVSTALREPA